MGFGSELWGEYLQRHFPLPAGARPRIEYLSGEEVARFLYPYMQAIGSEALARPAKPTLAAEREVDQMLRVVAREGEIDAVARLSPEGLSELYDRLSWALSAALIEQQAGSNWSIPVPLDAPQEVQAMTVLLTVLAGPGRDRPPQWPRRGSLEL